MIPNGSDHMIRRALGYLSPEKVLQWAQVTICPKINAKDISRIQRDMPRSRGVVRAGRARDANLPPIAPTENPRDTGTLGKKIDAFIAARSKECGVHPDFYRRSLGWR